MNRSNQPGGDLRAHPDDRLGPLISLLERTMRKTITEAIAPLDLTLQQYVTLTILNNNEKISNADLAKRSFISPQSANEMIKNMELKGLVLRRPDPNHGRIIHLHISAKGKKLLEKADSAVLDIEHCLRDTIAVADRDKFRNQLIGCLGALLQRTSRTSPIGDVAEAAIDVYQSHGQGRGE